MGGGKKACIFDMDGLLIDNEPLNKRSWQASVRGLGYELDDEKYIQLLGMRMHECEQLLLHWFGSGFPLDKFRRYMFERRETILKEEGVRLKTGAVEFIEYLVANNIACALATSSTIPEVKKYLQNTDLLSRFEVIVTAEDIRKSKPNPEIYLLTCKRLAISPVDAYVFEDSIKGMQAAFASGCKAVMIPDLIPPTPEIKRKAYKIYPTLFDAFEIFQDQKDSGIKND